jgi:hypothetical protein
LSQTRPIDLLRQLPTHLPRLVLSLGMMTLTLALLGGSAREAGAHMRVSHGRRCRAATPSVRPHAHGRRRQGVNCPHHATAARRTATSAGGPSGPTPTRTSASPAGSPSTGLATPTPTVPVTTPPVAAPTSTAPPLPAAGTPTVTNPLSPTSLDAKTPCVYASDHISMLDTFSDAVGLAFQCAMVFNDAAPGWSGWVDPWFINRIDPDLDWASWATAPGTHRRLVITQNLFPSSENSSDWLALGASGAFDGYAQQLAHNLVNAGLGSSIIRLAHEANGDWYPDSIPNTPAGDAEWVQFWRNTVIAMRSVPGANFLFDWTVNPGYRKIPLLDWYPGDDVVDIIGVDAYDSGVPNSVPYASRWTYLYNEPDGLGAVESFAAAHSKPLSIPEWGIGPAAQPNTGQGGDDPAYVRGIASVVANDNVAYQSYFDADAEGQQFFNSPLSAQAYRAAFAPGGLVGTVGDAADPPLPVPSPAPALAVTAGPQDGSTIASDTATFSFTGAELGFVALCSLDGTTHACSTSDGDTLQNLGSGYHDWTVEEVSGSGVVSLIGRDFVVASGS